MVKNLATHRNREGLRQREKAIEQRLRAQQSKFCFPPTSNAPGGRQPSLDMFGV